MFFQAEDGRDYRIDDVRSVSRMGDERLRMTLAGSDDEPVVSERAWDHSLAKYTKAFQPAQPGTYVVCLCYNENRTAAGYNRTAVLGWSIGADGFLHAVTVNGIDHGEGETPPVLHPDGRVEDPFDCVYDTADEWFAAAKERADRKARREFA